MTSSAPNRTTLTVSEAHDLLPTRACDSCGALTVEIRRNPNNNGQFVACPCGATFSRVWAGTPMWLTHDENRHVKRRKPYPMGKSAAEIWEKFRNHCAVCTAPMGELAAIGIGITAHHVTGKYDPDDYDCPTVPVCTACKTFVDARQREVWRYIYKMREIRSGR